MQEPHDPMLMIVASKHRNINLVFLVRLYHATWSTSAVYALSIGTGERYRYWCLASTDSLRIPLERESEEAIVAPRVKPLNQGVSFISDLRMLKPHALKSLAKRCPNALRRLLLSIALAS